MNFIDRILGHIKQVQVWKHNQETAGKFVKDFIAIENGWLTDLLSIVETEEMDYDFDHKLSFKIEESRLNSFNKSFKR